MAGLLSGCEVSKRRYMKGWYFSSRTATKSLVDHKLNECVVANDRTRTAKEIPVVSKNAINEDFSSSFDHLEIKKSKRTLSANKILERKIDFKKQKRPGSGYNNKGFLIGEYTTFGLSLASAALGFATLSNFVTLAIVFFALACILFIVSVTLSQIAIRKIRNQKLDHKTTPHAIITGITLGIFCLVVSGILALIAALVTTNLTIIIVSGLVTFLLLLLISLSKI